MDHQKRGGTQEPRTKIQDPHNEEKIRKNKTQNDCVQ